MTDKPRAQQNVTFEYTYGDKTFKAKQAGDSLTLDVWVGTCLRKLYGLEIDQLRVALEREEPSYMIIRETARDGRLAVATGGLGRFMIHSARFGSTEVQFTTEALAEFQRELDVASDATCAGVRTYQAKHPRMSRTCEKWLLQERTLASKVETDALLAELRGEA